MGIRRNIGNSAKLPSFLQSYRYRQVGDKLEDITDPLLRYLRRFSFVHRYLPRFSLVHLKIITYIYIYMDCSIRTLSIKKQQQWSMLWTTDTSCPKSLTLHFYLPALLFLRISIYILLFSKI